MLSFDTYISRKLPLVGLISAVFIIYPNIACLPWDIKFLEGVSCTGFYWYFVYCQWQLFSQKPHQSLCRTKVSVAIQ